MSALHEDHVSLRQSQICLKVKAVLLGIEFWNVLILLFRAWFLVRNCLFIQYFIQLQSHWREPRFTENFSGIFISCSESSKLFSLYYEQPRNHNRIKTNAFLSYRGDKY
jgi:hypothetical protein